MHCSLRETTVHSFCSVTKRLRNKSSSTQSKYVIDSYFCSDICCNSLKTYDELKTKKNQLIMGASKVRFSIHNEKLIVLVNVLCEKLVQATLANQIEVVKTLLGHGAVTKFINLEGSTSTSKKLI